MILKTFSCFLSSEDEKLTADHLWYRSDIDPCWTFVNVWRYSWLSQQEGLLLISRGKTTDGAKQCAGAGRHLLPHSLPPHTPTT